MNSLDGDGSWLRSHSCCGASKPLALCGRLSHFLCWHVLFYMLYDVVMSVYKCVPGVKFVIYMLYKRYVVYAMPLIRPRSDKCKYDMCIWKCVRTGKISMWYKKVDMWYSKWLSVWGRDVVAPVRVCPPVLRVLPPNKTNIFCDKMGVG
jgi:hypothetical protein